MRAEGLVAVDSFDELDGCVTGHRRRAWHTAVLVLSDCGQREIPKFRVYIPMAYKR